ncbi:unnamed protein product [Paramecium pentaurelia]|uniref:Ion transport domain-containing protein n=1 Tax=Paramecium pentaurelia TaxID=43138 RepID=A0A8S1WZ65_9CILI|nr:unnamed protein product [Paramecium pentaurelia]
MLPRETSPQEKSSAKQLELKRQKSSRFTISNQMMKRSPTRFLKEMKSLKKYVKQNTLKSLKKFQPYENNDQNSSDSSEYNNVDEKLNPSEKKISIPNLSFKETFFISMAQQEQLTNNSSDQNCSNITNKHMLKNLKKCFGDSSSICEINSQDQLLDKRQENFHFQDQIEESEIQQIEKVEYCVEDLDPRILKKYQKHKELNPFEDPYYVVLTPLHGLDRLKHELKKYNDHLKFLKLRKFIVFSFLCIPMYFQKIVDSQLFKLINGICIICNLILFTLNNSNPPITNEKYNQFIFYCFTIEIFIRILAAGGIYPTIHFLYNKEDIFNLSCTIISFLHYFYPKQIPFDPTPLRIITILLYLGDGLLRLKYMLIALKKSLVFLAEALFILLISALFFSIIGVSLFQGLFNYRCQPIDGNQIDNWIQCYQSNCPEGMHCMISSETPKLPTSFNNIFLSFGQILRIITMDDWSWLMFFTMRIFHPWIWIYYLIIIFFCGFFSINLVIAVLKIHYSEATIECQEFEKLSKQKNDHSLQRQEMFLSKDVISYFDLSFLRYIGFYSVLKKHKHLLNIAQPLNEQIEDNFRPEKLNQINRLLSSKQKKILNEAQMKLNQNSIWNKFKNFSLKNLLLPKFKELKKVQDQVNIKLYSDDPIEISILLKLIEYNFTQLNNSVNYHVDQKYNSIKDIFVQKKRIGHKEKIQMYYQHFQSLKKVKSNKRQQQFDNSINKYPIHKSTRRITIQKTLSKKDESLDMPSPQIIRRNNDIQSTIYMRTRIENQLPFEHINKGQRYILIQGYYINYEQIQEKINMKIPKLKQQIVSNHEVYQQIFQREREQKIIKTKNWSGNNVLQMNPVRFQKFEEIFNSMNNFNYLIWMPTIGGKLLIIRRYTLIILDNQITQLFFDLIILINFIFLSLYGIADPKIILKCENISTFFLLIEISLQMFTYPLQRFFSNKENMLQAIIMIASFIEFSFSEYLNLTEQYLRLIRGTKCILFYRCLKYNQMAVLIGKIASITFTQYIYLTIFMFIIIIIYAMIGMDLYSNKFDQNDSYSQLHSFDDLIKAIMTIFNIMTNDWYRVYILGSEISIVASMIYSFSMVIILNYLTYGLVLAILLDGFGRYLDEKAEVDQSDKQIFENQITSARDEEVLQTELDSTKNLKVKSEYFSLVQIQEQEEKVQPKVKLELMESFLRSLKQLNKLVMKSNPKLFQDIQCESSLYLFEKTSKIRIICYNICSSQAFYWFTNFILILSIIVMIIRTYHDFEFDKSEYPYILLMILNVFMFMEDILCIIAKGLCMDKGSHINYSWQIIDLIYLIGFFINSYNHNQLVKICLFLGHFRPMKLMYRIKWLDKIRAALAQSLLDILKILLTLISVWIMFGVFGIILYESQFGFCDDKLSYDINKKECEQSQRQWINFKFNFDNITIALPTLFVISTFDGWGEILQVAENSRHSKYGPSPYANYISTYAYFISFCFVGSMFFLSFFTGTLYSKLRFNQHKIEKQDATKFQREFKELSPIILKDTPVFSTPPTKTIRRFASFIVNNSLFQKFMFLMLLIDLICQLQYHHDMDVEYMRKINIIQRFIIFFYLQWIALLFISLGINRYFDNNWRRYYIVLIVISLCDLIADLQNDWVIHYFQSNVYTSYYQLLRLAFMTRQLRLLVIFQVLTNLSRLIRVMGFALPFLAKLISILIITMIIYALIGCQLFGKINKGAVIDDFINFTNFEYALLALYKCASGDDFKTIMTDTMYHNPYCIENSDYCGSVFNQLYFITFILFSNYVLLNLFILGLIEQFEEFFQVQNSMIQTYVEEIDKIKTAWCKYSAETNGQSMHYKFLCRFLLDIGQPLGGGKDDNLWDVAKLSSKLNLRCDACGYIQYNQLLYQLFRRCYHDEIFKDGSQESIQNMKQFNKEMQIRLLYYRRNKSQQRSNISQHNLQFKSNFNILHDYLNVLILFKTWQSYSKLLVQKIIRKQDDYTESDEITLDGNLQNNPQYWQQVQSDFINDGLFSSKRRTTDIKLSQDQFSGHQVTPQSTETQGEPQLPIYQTVLQQETDRIFGGFDENVVLDYKEFRFRN